MTHLSHTNASVTTKKITVKYFASLAESAEKTQENLEVGQENLSELYNSLKAKYNFQYEIEQIRVAVNTSYVDFSYELKDGDTLVFISPVAGG